MLYVIEDICIYFECINVKISVDNDCK